MSGDLVKFGIGKETTYGTAVAPTRAYEIISEDFRGKYPRVEAEALSAYPVARSDRYAVNNKGAAGTLNLEPMSKGFGDLLAFMMGGTVATATVETGVFRHTATIGSLVGKALTMQVARPDESDTLRPWTYEGGKVTNFEFSNQVDQTLRCSLGMDFERESNPDTPAGNYTLTALNALTISAMEILQWQGGTVTLDGSPIEAADLSFRVDNSLNVDRYFINQAQTKKEPKVDGKRTIEFGFRTPYNDNGFWEKVSSATNAGANGALVAEWKGLTLIGATQYPGIKITVPYARFDEGGPVVAGPSMLEQTISGRGLWNGTDSAITIEYTSTDATVLS